MLLIVIAALCIALVVQQRRASRRQVGLESELTQLRAQLAKSSLNVKAQDEERARMLRILQDMQEQLAKRTEAETQRHPQ